MLSYLALITAVSLGVISFISQDEFGKMPTGERLDRIKKSSNYKDNAFQNIEQTNMWGEGEGNSAIVSLWNYFRNKSPRQIPKDAIPSDLNNLQDFAKGDNKAIWFGHSSFMLTIVENPFEVGQ